MKDQEDFKTIFMYDDFTPLRAKLLRAAKNHPNVRSAYTRDGINHCNIQNGSHVVVESPDDLFHLGVDDINWNEFGLNYIDF